MKAKKLMSVVLTLALATSIAGCGAPKTIEAELDSIKQDNLYINDDEDHQGVIKWLKYEIEALDYRGTVMVASDEEIVFAAGTGLLDIDGNEVTPYTTYEIGSCSKTFTAVCVMKLIEDGNLKMTDTLGNIFPEYGSYPNYDNVSKITVSNLLHMRSGLTDYVNDPVEFLGEEKVIELLGPEPDKDYTYAEAYRIFEKVIDDKCFMERIFTLELKNEPDTKFVYDNSNYHLLALIIEKVTGKAFEDYVNEVIFEPCGMTSSSAVKSGDVTASFKYDPELDYLSDPEFMMGAGDIHSSAVDLLKFDRALFGGKILNSDSMAELMAPIDGYACGLELEHGRIGHNGDVPRFAAANWTLQREGTNYYVIALTNHGEDHRTLLIRNLDRML